MIEPVGVGVIGCGDICGIYFQNIAKYKPLNAVACADMMPERAKSAAEKYGVPNALTVDQLLAHPDVELVIDLTVPKAHAPVNNSVLEAGKHVYTEKPLAINREAASDTLARAKTKGLLVGSAPDTFLGAALQTCRKLIEDGAIGEPVGVNAFMLGQGPETFHHDPAFFYEVGAGPMFDMGPYYLTALVNLLGPVNRVTSSARISFPERVIHSEPRKGQMMKVYTPTHIVGVMDFASGAVGQLGTSFDVWATRLPNIEIYGSEGTLSVPDPNNFGGKIEICRSGSWDWEEVPFTHGFAENSRGLGVMDMAYAIRTGRPHRASGALAFHVLDIMQSFLDASEQGKHLTLKSGVEKPAAMATGLPEDDLLQ